MARTLVSSDKLRAWLNSELKKHDECADCEFGGVTPYRRPDEDGCNWSEPILRCSGQPTVVCSTAGREVLAQARARFNVG